MRRVVICLVCMLCFSIKAGAEVELVIVTDELPPFTSVDFNKSFLTELFQTLEVEMGVIFVFKFMPWKRCEIEVQEQAAWGMVPYIRTKERDKLFDCSEKLYARQAVFFYRSPDGKEKNIHYKELLESFNAALKKIKENGRYEEVMHRRGLRLDY